MPVRSSQARRIPEPRHDRQQLVDAVFSIKASFRNLDHSGTRLGQAVARSRTRLLAQILNSRDVRKNDEDTSAKPPLPTMPWSKPRVDNRPVAKVFASAAEAFACHNGGAHSTVERRQEEPEANKRVRSTAADSDSDIDSVDSSGISDSRSSSTPDEAGLAPEWSSVPLRQEVVDQTHDDDVPRGTATITRWGDRKDIDAVADAVQDQRCTVSTSNRQTLDVCHQPSPRFQLRVQANRPFSAPQIKRDRSAFRTGGPRRPLTAQPAAARPAIARPATARPVLSKAAAEQGRERPSRPSSAIPTCHRGGGGAAGRPVSASGTRTAAARPRSAFGNLQRRQDKTIVWERPPTTPLCEPQSRCMEQDMTIDLRE
eukprot:TRINITY_DN63641_c0_g1_i1.p1 TRINITY_DN63641_c0_g1~~TRINITY_DN63641_c0_g1_i1.p1  ORF type:complete len:371 (+),score=33.06 TRINITY_DN63641_c0_g1_i1:50-1162(+)